VTGTIREYWENADGAEKLVLETKMQEIFEPNGIKSQGDSYFMPQDEEGTLELVGSQQMYANLVAAGMLDAGTTVVGSFGIGKGSCQWMIQEADGNMALVGHKAGMTNLPKLAELTRTLTEAYRDPTKWTKFKQSLKAAGKGTIALKSGAALLIDNKAFAYVKAELVAPKTYPKRTVRVALEAERRIVLTHTWAGSLDRLCAEVQVKFANTNTSDLEVIFRDVEGKFIEVARDEKVVDNEVLYFAPRGVVPDLGAAVVVIHVEPSTDPLRAGALTPTTDPPPKETDTLMPKPGPSDIPVHPKPKEENSRNNCCPPPADWCSNAFSCCSLM